MKDKDKIIHNGTAYVYYSSYGRFEAEDRESKHAILCPKCMASMFSISYGDYECIANCVCGNSFVIYDG